MQINSSSNTLTPYAPGRQLVERIQRDEQRDRTPPETDQPVRRSSDVADVEVQQRRIELQREVSDANFQRQEANDQLPLRNQLAVQAFQNNAPSIEEQLGVELVGVDTFA